METVRTRQRIHFGKRIGKYRDWFLKQVKDRLVGSVSKWLRQSFELVPDPVLRWDGSEGLRRLSVLPIAVF
jgi:hypothetical protein